MLAVVDERLAAAVVVVVGELSERLSVDVMAGLIR